MSELIAVHHLNITQKSGRKIVSDVSFVARRGELNAIMGPSGCGKTSVMDSLAGRLQSGLNYSGAIKLHGKFKYVPQEERLHGFYTVHSYIGHYLDLNYGFLEGAHRQAVIESVIRDTGLVSSAKTRVGDIFLKGLSGGQKRRLSIALELIARPDILLLDEPTSGLDSVSAYFVMDLLKQLARQGVAVICVLHQPSSQIYNMLDKITLLSQGHMCFHGTVDQASAFFELQDKVCPVNFNPSDFYLFQINADFNAQVDAADLARKFSIWSKTATEGGIGLLTNAFEADNPHIVTYVDRNADGRSIQPQALARIEQIHQRGGFFSKFVFLIRRYLLNLFMNPGILLVRLVMYLMLCLIIGFMYFQLGSYFDQKDIVSRASLLFYVDAFLVFMSIAVLPFFMTERAILEKEINNRLYSTIHYQVAMFVTSLPGVGLIAIICSLLVNLIANLNGFGYFFLLLFLSLVCAESLALLVSLLVPHYIIGMALIAGLYGVFMICQGFLIVYDNIPGYFIWIYYIGFHTYSFEGFMINEFRPIAKFTGTSDFTDGNSVLRFYGMEKGEIWKDIVILIGYFLILQLMVACVLMIRFRRRKVKLVEIANN